jgi:hypothetical protein
MTAARTDARLPPAPLWDWHDMAVAAICAPHFGILGDTDRSFLWRLDRRRQPPSLQQRDRLHRIVTTLDRYALDNGIRWP